MSRFYLIQSFENQKNDAGDVIANHKLALAVAITLTLFKV